MQTQQRNRIVVAHLGLVAHALVRLGRPGDPDLYQEGALGLMRAAERYDARRGVAFSTFASTVIANAIKDALARDSVVHFPKRQPRVAILPLPAGL